MRSFWIISVVFACVLLSSCKGCSDKTNGASRQEKAWAGYYPGRVDFVDRASGTKGSDIYRAIVPDPEAYISEHALKVLKTLYFSPEDSIPRVRVIHYTLEDSDGISAKSGGGDSIHIFYSARWVERSLGSGDTARVDYETRGVLYHELTHAYQLEPQGCGTYADGGEFWAFIEGMADAVRVANGCFGPDDRPRGGHYLDGYRTTGFFLHWLNETKDNEFIKKFNRSTLEVVPWSFDAAFRHIFGDEEPYRIQTLWEEYLRAMGDVKDEVQA